jgi:hypothetical protein
MRPARPPRAALRVETSALDPYPPTHPSGPLRHRSNSAQSHTPVPQYPSHHFSRSLSHTAVAVAPLPSSPLGGRHDVALAVNGLRGVTEGGLDASLSSPVSPENGVRRLYHYRDHEQEHQETIDEDIEQAGEEETLRAIREALESSKDQGDTLDLSRRGIRRIGPEAVEMFRRGVGQDKKGVWR